MTPGQHCGGQCSAGPVSRQRTGPVAQLVVRQQTGPARQQTGLAAQQQTSWRCVGGPGRQQTGLPVQRRMWPAAWQQAGLAVWQTLEDLSHTGSLGGATWGTHHPLLAEGAKKQGTRVIGYLQDYNTLMKQIFDGKTLIHQMASILQPGLKLQDNTVTGKIFCQENIRKLLVHTSSLHQILEKSTSLLAMFWRASPPMPRISAPEQSVAEEIQILRAKLAEQENCVQSANRIQGSMENFILTHLTGTYNVLKKARINLEGMSQQPKLISSTGH
ncbi:myomegalin-like [Candoia aspera]|uniref:myomegalin-like n=1 Tax=Candoia aspera TaxID=51853 RepID=UPI002FD7B755